MNTYHLPVSGTSVLTDLFKTAERVKILRHIGIRETFTVHSVAGETGLSKGLVSAYLNFLLGECLLSRENRTFRRNDDAMWQAVKLVLNIDLLREKASLPPWADGIGIYGSWAEGTNESDSDLDVWVSVRNYNPDLEFAVGELQHELSYATGNDTHALILTREKLQDLKAHDIPFYTTFRRSHLTLCGEDIDKA
jgi:predicted nucleotidyltransferase